MDQQPLHDKTDCLSFPFIYFWIVMLVVHISSMLCKILVLRFLDFLIILPLGLVFEILIKKRDKYAYAHSVTQLHAKSF